MEQFFSSGFGIILYFVFLFGIMWFIMIRPQRKREKALVEMQNSIEVGNMVVTNTGMYGKVVDIIDNIFVVEFGLNRGVQIPIEKSSIAGIKEPDLSIKKHDEPIVEDKNVEK